MTKARNSLKLVASDAAKFVDADESVADYMTAALEATDPDLLLLALSGVARAKKGRAQVAKTRILGLAGEHNRHEARCRFLLAQA